MQAVRPALPTAPIKTMEMREPFWTWKKVALAAAAVFAAGAVASFATGHLPLGIACAAISLTLVAIVAIAILLDRRSVSLTPELLDHLVRDATYGLRCVRDIASAERHQQDNVFGDSLNLDPSVEGVWKEFCPDDPIRNNEPRDLNWYRLSEKRVSLRRKKQVIARWEQGVDDFIRFQVREHSIPAFVLLKYAKDQAGAYDCDRYGKGLGKRGQSSIAPENVAAIISPPTFPITEDQKVRYYRSELIRCIAQQKGNK